MKNFGHIISQKQPLEAFCSKRCSLIFAKFTGKHMCQCLFFNKIASPATLLKKRLWHMYFPINFSKFLRAPFLQNTLGQVLLISFAWEKITARTSARSSHQRCSMKKGVLRNFAKLAGKHLSQSIFLELFYFELHGCFTVNFAKFLKMPFLQNTSGWLLLECDYCLPA